MSVVSITKVSKTTTLQEPVGQVPYKVLQKFISAYGITPNCRRIKLLLVNNVHEKTSQKVKRGEILKVSAHHL